MGKIVALSGNTIDIDGVPEEIKILPMGHVISQKGEFNVDEESLEMILKHFKERGIDVVVDYEHQTLKDVQAPAGGWITGFYQGEDAIIAKVKWTDKAKEYLKNKEYRYLSPVIMVRRKDGKVTTVHSVALTNTPAINGMFAMVNSANIEDFEDDEEENQMDLKKLAALLGLPEDATEEDVEKKLAEIKASMEANKEEVPVANSVVLSLLELKEDAKTEDVVTKIMSLKTSGSDEELKALKQQLEEKNAEEAVQRALKEGKITAAQKEWALSYALSDKNGFDAFIEKAPVVVNMGQMELKDAPAANKDDCHMEILKNCGISEEDYKKYHKED